MQSLKELGKQYWTYAQAGRTRDLTPEVGSIDTRRLLQPLEDYMEQECIVMLDFEWVAESPYSSVYELRLASTYGTVKMQQYRECNTPCQVDYRAFSLFRAYHDIIHHVLMGMDFTPLDEFRAAQHLLSLYSHDKLVQSFVYSNVACMNSVYEWSPSRWAKLQNYTDILCVCPCFHTLTPHRKEYGNV